MDEEFTQPVKGWSSPNSLLTRLFSGDPWILLLSLVVALLLPVLLHFYFYTTSPSSSSKGVSGAPSFLLLGPTGSGKTSFLTLLQRRFAHELSKSSSTNTSDRSKDSIPSTNGGPIEASQTRTTQITSTIGLFLPASIPLGSNKYRSVNDPTLKSQPTTRYQLIDTPGHGKLRSDLALSYISSPNPKAGNVNLKGVIYLLDSTAFSESTDSPMARDTVTYLHDALLALQRRKTSKAAVKTKALKADVPVLIAANKQDLFTALPAGAIRQKLESELERIRVSRSKGISAVDSSPEDGPEEEDILGGGGEEKFTFKLLEDEYGIVIDVIGGAVKGEEAGKGVLRWEEWMGSCL